MLSQFLVMQALVALRIGLSSLFVINEIRLAIC